MRISVFNFLSGYSLFRAEGVFAERVINILGDEGIFIWGVRRTDNRSLAFFVSRRAKKRLLERELPYGIKLIHERDFGLPVFFAHYKRRKAFIICPLVFLCLLALSTAFIWNVNVITDDHAEEEKILSELKELGVKRGALKMFIDQGEIKRLMLLKDETLSWIWVDIKGSGAVVRYAKRTAVPEVFDEKGFFNVYSARDAVIEELIVRNGTARVAVGDSVTEGQLLIEGCAEAADGAVTLLHASGDVMGSVWEEKNYSIQKKREIRTATGHSFERLSIKFSDFLLKLFINSRILYPTYDIIEEEHSLAFLSVTFVKTTVSEVSVSYADEDVSALIKKGEENFSSSLKELGEVTYIESVMSDTEDSVGVTVRALVRENVAIERRMNIGENNSLGEP